MPVAVFLAIGEGTPRLLLEGATPRLIDERRAKGQFIFTGSTAPGADATSHSGAGRFVRMTISTMTLFETGESDGSVSLAAVVAGDPLPFSVPALTLPELAERVCRGGLPYNVGLPLSDALDNVRITSKPLRTWTSTLLEG